MYKEIEVFSQAELDAIPQDFYGRILIKFGTWDNRAKVNRTFEHSSVVAWENSSVEAWGNSSVVACGNSSVVAWENSSVVAWGNYSVEAWGNSSVVAWENSSVVARGNTQVVAASELAKVETSNNARIVYNPKTPKEYAEHYGLECNDGLMILYKAVHKRSGHYFSDRDSDFCYEIGEKALVDSLDKDPYEDCGRGIHAACMAWCVEYGRSWNDLAILEVEMPMETMAVPINGSGKVRADWARVLREVPLEECGLLGKMLAKRRERT